MPISKRIRVNRQIRAAQVRVIDAEGKQLGVMAPREALSIAEAQGYDLVEVSPNADPPVCRILDYGKFMYQLSKKAKETRKKQHFVHVKEVKLRPGIEEHDFQFKLRHVRRFLAEHDKVKLTVVFRGREITHLELGKAVLNRMIEGVSDLGAPEGLSRREGSSLVVILGPKGIRETGGSTPESMSQPTV